MYKLAIVTGSGRGLGAELVEVLLSKGRTVEGITRGKARGKRHAYLESSVDLSDANLAEAAFSGIQQRHPEISEALLINNAGKYSKQTIQELDAKDFRLSIETNFLSAVFSTMAFLRYFNRGHMLFMSSYNAKRPTEGSAAYGSAKTALARFAESLRLELDPSQYRVITLFAGSINTWSGERIAGTITVRDMAEYIVNSLDEEQSYWCEEAVVVPRV